MKPGVKRRIVLLTVLAASITGFGLASVGLGTAGAATATSRYAGTWTVTDTPGGSFQLDFVPVTPGGDTYNITFPGSFFANGVVITGGSVEIKETCNGCVGYDLYEVTFSKASHNNTFSGTYQEWDPHSNAPGSPLFDIGGGNTTGTQAATTRGTSDWPRAKCERIYKAWAKAHPHAKREQKATEKDKLNSKHDCEL